jgi:hypothetical protein
MVVEWFRTFDVMGAVASLRGDQNVFFLQVISADFIFVHTSTVYHADCHPVTDDQEGDSLFHGNDM